MNRFQKFVGQWRSTQQYLERLRGDNAAALEALYFLQERACLQDGTLRETHYEGVNWSSAALAAAHLERIYLCGATLHGVYLHQTHLEGADLSDVDLQGANLRAVYLQGASLANANLQHVNLARADLRGVNLRHADLQGANIWGADLRGADLTDVMLRGANIVYIEADATTRLPDGTLWHPRIDWTQFL